MNRKIESYHAAWNPKLNIGYLRLFIEGMDKPFIMKDINAQEFTSIMSILQGESVAYITQNGWIATAEIEDL